ncbi:MAG: prolyl oligopeptidase family serine peptidase, partial [Verrucomicrobiota bacterium]|nr:prolyl oligopeptidase family serine peptidase [Verrucomicrobiota bacterium]
MQLKEHNPIERLAPIAQAKIPVLHVHGDADKVVPLEQNSAVIAERYKALGGPMELVVVPGKGHQNDPAFFESEPIFQFLMKHGLAVGTGAL